MKNPNIIAKQCLLSHLTCETKNCILLEIMKNNAIKFASNKYEKNA